MKSNKAFTLIELIVVVSIISIVSAVFIPLLYREVKQKNANKIVKPYKIGDVVYVKGLGLTGVVKSVNWNCSEVLTAYENPPKPKEIG